MRMSSVNIFEFVWDYFNKSAKIDNLRGQIIINAKTILT